MKKLLKISALLGVLLLAVFGVLTWVADRFLREEELVRLLEESINSRVHIGALETSLWSLPSRVVLRDVRLGVRDEEVLKPYRERKPLQGASVEIAEVRFSVSLWALAKRQIAVRELVVREPRVTMMLFERGGNSLDELLRSPDAQEESTHESAFSEGQEQKGSGKTLHVSQLDFLATLTGVGMEEGMVRLVVEKTGLAVKIEELNIGLHDLEVNPAALETMNAAEFEVSGTLVLDSARQPQDHYAVLDLSGPVSARLFDPDTGDFALSAHTDLQLGSESYLSTDIPALTKSWSQLEILEKVGIKIGPLPEKATFGRSESLALHYQSERITLEKPVSLILDDWELALYEESWIQTEKETHRVVAELVAGAKASRRLRKELEKGLRKLPKEIRRETVEAVEKAWFREGSLYAEIESEGDLSRPSLDVANKLPDLEEIAKRAAKRYAREKLKSLFR